jgi:hypothetical protein
MANVLTTDYLQSQEYYDGQNKTLSAARIRDGSESASGLPISLNSPRTSSGTYIAQFNDRGAVIAFNVASGTAVYQIPPRSTVAFPFQSMLGMLWLSGGAIGPTFQAGAGVTIVSPTGNLTCRAVGSLVWAWQYSQDVWYLMGDLT